MKVSADPLHHQNLSDFSGKIKEVMYLTPAPPSPTPSRSLPEHVPEET
jgi:hypothetical protein